MNRLNKHIILLLLVLSSSLSIAQGQFFLKDKVSQKIKFEFAANLIIIPLEINGVELSFVLDTGVSKPILFNLSHNDSLDLKNTKTFYLHGLGAEGKIEALKSSYNRFRLGDAVGNNQDLYVVFDSTINFTPRLGIVVNGIIGYDVFKDFVVEINYASKFLRLHKPETFRPKKSKKWKQIPIEIYRKKPYLDGQVVLKSNVESVKLLMDTGSSDALWLFENKEKGILPNDSLFFMDYLGKGLSGSVYGKRSKIKNFRISDFSLDNVNVAYPDSSSIDISKIYKDRNGSIGGDILKRYNMFVDYGNEMLYLKKNSYFKKPFTYNNSGIVLEHNGTMFVNERIKLPSSDGYTKSHNPNAVKIDLSISHRMLLKPMYKVVELRKSSNAFAAGLRVGDILLAINGREVYNLKLNQINEILHGDTGRSVRLKIERYGKVKIFRFKLDNAFKKNEPSN
ncbi:retropepsin-like aspartic protease [Winogradskyella aquimaris]|uniref:Aspartyl protease family protein n=1 Tax=Winogradskyella aquimaris TaxID=864074 RepID=A0ABU5EQM3_9FLAO|nr:aspartyl protease family protein [Winogradskyella aquimaris]MDY2586982.1 aspartyl protease family protein [Winogradskyella aquimaris]